MQCQQIKSPQLYNDKYQSTPDQNTKGVRPVIRIAGQV